VFQQSPAAGGSGILAHHPIGDCSQVTGAMPFGQQIVVRARMADEV
jgi:hypothetical protein